MTVHSDLRPADIQRTGVSVTTHLVANNGVQVPMTVQGAAAISARRGSGNPIMQRPGEPTQPPYDTSLLLGPAVGTLHRHGIDATPEEAFVPSRAASAAPLEEAVDLAVEAWRNPATVTEAPYGLGPDAYDRWPAALEGDALDEHGNRWNASVWSECRGFASRYLAAPPTSSAWLDGASAQVPSEQYEQVAARFRAVSDKTHPTADRHALVAEARELDTDCIERLERLGAD